MPGRSPAPAGPAAPSPSLLITLGAIVGIPGSGRGWGDHWPLCNGKLLPPLDLPTLIEYGHRLAAAAVSVLVAALAVYGWWLRREAPSSTALHRPGAAAYVALMLLVLQVALGAVTVKLSLPPWTVILHLGTAILLLATLIVAAKLTPDAARPSRGGLWALGLGFVTVLFGALTANLGAASACLGFPLCNGQVVPAGNYLQALHWGHRLLGVGLLGSLAWWTWRTRRPGPTAALVIAVTQVGVAAALVLLALPRGLQVAHAAVGTALWAVLVVASRGER